MFDLCVKNLPFSLHVASAMPTQIVAHDGVHLLSYLARQIAHFLAHQVPAKRFGYHRAKMMAFVENTIE